MGGPARNLRAVSVTEFGGKTERLQGGSALYLVNGIGHVIGQVTTAECVVIRQVKVEEGCGVQFCRACLNGGYVQHVPTLFPVT